MKPLSNPGIKPELIASFLALCLAVPSTSLVAQNACTPQPAGLVAWWQGEGNAFDIVGGNNGVLENGVGFTSGVVGQAFVFNGTNQWVEIPDSPALDPTNALTLEAWVYVSGYPNTDLATIITKFSPNVPQLNQYQLETHLVGTNLYFRPLVYLPSGYGLIDGKTVIRFNTWYHVAMTYDGSVLNLYVNGVLDGSVAATGTIAPTPMPLRIGGPSSGPWWFKGQVDEVSLYARALSSNEIAAIYNAGSAGKCVQPITCTPPPAGLVAWWKGEDNAVDVVGGNDGVLENGVTFDAGEVGQAFVFNGTNQWVEIPDSPALDPTNALTLEAWVYVSGYPNTDLATIITKFSPSDPTQNQYQLETHYAGGRLNFRPLLYLPSGYGQVDGKTTIQFNTWYHVAMTYDGSTLNLYVNGALDGTVAASGAIAPTKMPLRIGGPSSGPWWFKGQVDEVSLYNRALSSNEVAAIYNAGAAGKCVQPFVCTPPPSGLLGWWQGESNAVDIVSGDNGVLENGVGFAPGVVGRAFVFNGSNQWIEIPDSPALDPTNALSLEAWVCVSGYPNTDLATIITKFSPSDPTQNQYQLETHYAGGRLNFRPLVYLPSGYGLVDGKTTIQFNTWYHVAMTYDGSTLNLYVNGALDGTVAASGAIAPTKMPLRIGGPSSGPWWFKGRVDEVSLYDRALSSNEVAAIYNAGAAGKCVEPMPPSVEVQPQSQSAIVGSNVNLSVLAAGTLPLDYQWLFNQSLIADATNSSLTISNVTLARAGSYSVVITNVAGSVTSAPAVLTVSLPSASIQLGAVTVAEDGTVTVPVDLVANGNENSLGFSLNFDPTLLTNTGVALGSGATRASLFPNTAHAANGQVGVVIGLPAGSTFAAGTQEVVVVSFASPIVTSATSNVLTFGDSPVKRVLSDVFANPLPATFNSGSVLLPATQLEGDAYPRPNGDEALTVSDWVLIGRYVAGLDSPTNTLEFQKADCAPRDTLGDGQLTVSDWVQAGRYVAGLDPLTRAGGPTGPIPGVVPGLENGPVAPRTKSSVRQVRLTAPALLRGQIGTVQVQLEAQGNENALAFSLNFNPASLTYVGASTGTGAGGVILNVNDRQAMQGRLGLVLALQANQSFAAGTKQLVNVSFRVTPLAVGTSAIAFGDQPVAREVADPVATVLAAQYINANVAVSPLPALRITSAGQSVSLSWPASPTVFTLQESTDSRTWKPVTAPPSVVNNENVVSVPASASAKFYRLSQ